MKTETHIWTAYIPEEGHWPIDYSGPSEKEARAVYLAWSNKMWKQNRKRLPAGSCIVDITELSTNKHEDCNT